MKNLKQRILLQSGRSMVEVLGVIAIIGVLSICALTFYAYLIDKHHANILSNEILQRSLDVKKQLDNRKRNITLDKFDPQSKLGYTIDYDNVHIGIQVYDVPKRLCDMTLGQVKGVLDSKIYSADGETLLAECEENNTLVFAFEEPQKLSVQKGCPAGTPKNADPDTCECDLTQRYWEEATNTCVCWSGEEINGECVKSCTTSDDCDDNEVCEGHICIKIIREEPIETSDVMYSSKMGNVPETTGYETSSVITETTTDFYSSDTPQMTYISSTTTPKTTTSSIYRTNTLYTTTTSVYTTTSVPYTTTSIYETTLPETTTTSVYTTTLPETTTTSVYTTTLPETTTTSIYETTLPKTTSVVCPSDTPIWDGTQCVTCVSYNSYYPYWDGYQCVYECPLDKPIWNGKICVPCAEIFPKKPYLNDKVCVSYCPSDKPYLDNNVCVSSCSWRNPYLNDNRCVSSCPSDKPYSYNNKCVAETTTIGATTTGLPTTTTLNTTTTTVLETTEVEYTQLETTVPERGCPPSEPYLDGVTEECKSSCSSLNLIYQKNNGALVCCSEDKPIWNGSQCVTCETANSSLPVWDSKTQQCVSCTTATNGLNPYWNGTQCVSCVQANREKPYWNAETKQCEDCPRNTSWNNAEKQCMATNCSGVYSWLSSGLEITEFQMCSRYAGRDVYHHVGERINSAYIYGERKPSECRNHALRASGYIYAFRDGNYTFKTHAYSCSEHSNKVEVQITIDNKLVHNVTSACSTGTVTLSLTAGLHKINYYMYTLKRATAYLELQTSGAFFCSD